MTELKCLADLWSITTGLAKCFNCTIFIQLGMSL